MSFLNKLGDFAGGFAEGLYEQVPDILERQQDLQDEQRRYNRQLQARQEERQYNETTGLINLLAQQGDEDGLNLLMQKEPERTDYIGTVLKGIDGKRSSAVTGAIRTADVIGGRLGGVLNTPSSALFRQGYNPAKFKEDLTVIEDGIAKLDAVLDNTSYTLNDEDRDLIENRRLELLTLAEGFYKKEGNFATYTADGELNKQGLQLSIDSQDLEGYLSQLNTMLDNGQITQTQYSQLQTVTTQLLATDALSRGDIVTFDKIEAIGSKNPAVAAIVDEVTNKFNTNQALQIQNTYLTQMGTPSEAWKVDIQSQKIMGLGLAPSQTDAILEKMYQKQDAVYSDTMVRVGNLIPKETKDLQSRSYDPKISRARALNSLFRNGRIQKWEYERVSLIDDLRTFMPNSPDTVTGYVASHAPLIVNRAMSIEELIDTIEDSQALSRLEKIGQ